MPMLIDWVQLNYVNILLYTYCIYTVISPP